MFPSSVNAPLQLLPTAYLSPRPLYDLLRGFETDLEFSSSHNPFPIKDESDLHMYALRVAGTVGELFTELVYHHMASNAGPRQREEVVKASARMGTALQYVNIARDVSRDADIGRVYIPVSWLKEQGLTPEEVLKNPGNVKLEPLKKRLVETATHIYCETRAAIEQLPVDARGPTRVAIESYMEIGRVLQQSQYRAKASRATVPLHRRLKVAWLALNYPYDSA